MYRKEKVKGRLQRLLALSRNRNDIWERRNTMAENNNIQQNEAKTKVISGTARLESTKMAKEKVPLSKKLVNFLFSDRLDSMGMYIGSYVVKPSIMRLLYETGNTALQMLLLGGMNGQNSYPSNNMMAGNPYSTARRDPVPYNMMAGGYMGNPAYAQPQPVPYNPNRVGLNDISFDTKDDAWLVLDRMSRELMRYGQVKVADFYTFSGITGQESNWTLQSNGWHNLQTAKPILRTDGRWIIEFPPIEILR